MPRPPLPVGTLGNINTRKLGPRSWQADAYYRDAAGDRRRIQRRGTSKLGAESALKVAFAEGPAPQNQGGLDRGSRFSAVANAWHEELTANGKHSPSTVHLYREALDKHLLPLLGGLRFPECTTYRLSTAIKTIAEERGATTAKRAHTVLRNVYKFAIANDVTAVNIARDIPTVQIEAKPVTALTLEEARRLLAGLSGECHMVASIQLTTGLRIGEVLALRWADVDLSSDPPRVSVNATAVKATGQGYTRGAPKTAGSLRTVPMPRELADALGAWAREHVPAHVDTTAWAEPEALLFPDSRGGVRDPNNYRRVWRSQAAEAGFPGLETHALRKTASTLIERVHGAPAAAETLGDTEAVARKHYIAPRALTVDVTATTGALLR